MWPKKKQSNPKPLTHLQALHRQKKVSLEELARRSGVEKGTFKRTEQGKHHPFLSNLNRLDKSLGVDLDRRLGAISCQAARQG